MNQNLKVISIPDSHLHINTPQPLNFDNLMLPINVAQMRLELLNVYIQENHINSDQQNTDTRLILDFGLRLRSVERFWILDLGSV